jgi:hypothetical protein
MFVHQSSYSVYLELAMQWLQASISGERSIGSGACGSTGVDKECNFVGLKPSLASKDKL